MGVGCVLNPAHFLRDRFFNYDSCAFSSGKKVLCLINLYLPCDDLTTIFQAMKRILLFALCTGLLVSCKRELPDNSGNNPTNPGSIFELSVPNGFNYESAKDVGLEIGILNREDQKVSGVRVALYSALPEEGGKLVFKGITDKDGLMKATVRIPLELKHLYLESSFAGIPSGIELPVQGASIKLTLGGSNPQFVQTRNPEYRYSLGRNLMKNLSKVSNRIVPVWNANGVPSNLATRDVVPNTLVNDIWATLPSRVSVPQNRPELLDDNSFQRNIILTKKADVWVTFITEGAGFRNTLFFYRYNKNNPPTSVNQIDTLFLIFPNASLQNSNGGLLTGDKVYLGRFGADTVISYGIIANGFDATTSTVGSGFWFLYGNKNFNPEPKDSLRQHMVMLYDNVGKRFVMGFEDINRTASGCDHDFNDVMFYTTANPVDAISTDNIAVLPPSGDRDGDGVNDVDDEYPDDNARAFNNYYPSIGGKASLAFEDLWPFYGDYDMNDVVVDFRYKLVTNAQNSVKDVFADYTLRASGGQIENAFAVEFPTARANATAVQGAVLEAGQTNTVLAIYPNIRSVQNRWNTVPGEPLSDSVNKSVSFTLINPVAISSFGLGAFNPFIWGTSNGKNRGMEIHLPGRKPTSLATLSVLGTGNDRSNNGTNHEYLSEHNLPWAIEIPERFDYPIERSEITRVHLKFATWSQSGGVQFQDWYKSQSGYRNSDLIYKP